MNRTHVKRALVAVWAVALVLGAIGVLWRLWSEHADFGSYIPWGLWVALYAWFVGLSAGAYMLFAAGEVFRIERLRRIGRPALVIAFASLISGLIVVGLDLGHLERFWNVYLYGNPSSLMAWEISFYTAFGLLLPVTLVLAFRDELARFRPFARLAGTPDVDSAWIRPLALVGGVLAVAVSGATGALFGVVGSRPYWHTGLLPLLFIAAALLSAAAVLTVFAALTSEEKDGDDGEIAFLGRLTLGFLAIAALIEWADLSIAWAQHSQTAAGWAAWDLVLTGPRWWVFWIVHVVIGVVVPALLLLLRPRTIAAVGVAAGLVAVTLVSVRLNVVIPGLAVPQLEGLDEAYTGPGLTFDYSPTLQEWLVSIFAGALFVGLVGAWYRLVAAPRIEASAQPDALPPESEGAETRNEFLGKVGIAGGALLATQLPLALHSLGEPGDGPNSPMGSTPYPLAKPENILFSVCQQCNTQCGIKAKTIDGVLVKLDGNPYSPWTMKPPIPYDTPLAQAAAVDGWICPKGQAGIQSAYDPYRIRKVLKRDGPRGSGRWKTIDFDQAVSEIVKGGDHFGEGRVPGLAELWALRDPDLAKSMGDDVKAIWEGDLTVDEFRAKYRDDLDVLIDPDHPDLGPKNNQVVFAWGRVKSGRGELLRRFIQDSFGSTNAHGHTTVCQGSLYFAGKAMSEQWIDGRWQKGVKAYWQADAGGAEFVIFVGSSPFEANYGPPYRTSQITDGIVSGRLKIAVVDPRLSKTAGKAWKWLPARPGSEGALALAMIRWVIENERYDAAFLRNANKASAEANGETTWTNASWLVWTSGDNEGKLVRASEVGLGEAEERIDAKGKPYTYDRFVVLVNGKPVAVDPDEESAIVGDLAVSTRLAGEQAKSGFSLLSESASSKTLKQWAAIVDVPVDDIVELAQEFTSHGKKAAADVHRGVSQHTNGYSNVIAWNTLNALIGNYDWKGGSSKATTFSVTGDRDGEPIEGMPFHIPSMHPAKMTPFGISSIRHDSSYEKSTIFEGYPATRPWYPLSSDVYQEIVPSIGDAYPYPIKALFLYMGTPIYALPGGHTNIEILADPKKLPLFVTSDIVVGETSMYADYVFPDVSYLERWEFAGSHPNVIEKVQPIRQPVIAPLTDNVTVYGEEQPLTFEAMLFGLAEKLELPGFGPDGLDDGRPLSRPEDYHLLMAANVAAGDKENPVEPASDEEIALYVTSRRHLPKTVFDADRYEKIVGSDWWARTVTVLSRGGRFDSEGYDGDRLKNPYGKQLNVYQEKTAKNVNAMTGEHYPGVAVYVPAPQSSLGEDIVDPGFPLRLITFREIVHTKSRTGGNYWLLDLLPDNAFLLNTATARELGYRDGDWARLVSATNPEGVWPLGEGRTWPMVGRVRTIEGLRPGTVAFSLGHGHWAYGANEIVIDGDTVEADKRRANGFHGNAAMRVDPYLKNTCLADLTGGSAVFYDTSVRLERASESDTASPLAV